MKPPQIEIWFEFASTYSCLTVMRAERALAPVGLEPVWKPFLLGPLLKDRGFPTSPFVLEPVRGAYMWRDIERRARLHGLPFRRPSRFPANGLRAARVMTAARHEIWAGDFARAVMAAAFQRDQDISEKSALAQILDDLGVDAAEWLGRSETAEVKAELRRTTELAGELGMFGAPNFRVRGEIFWGDDRLEEAVLWACGRHPAIRPGGDG